MQIHPIAPQLQQPKFLTLSDFENAIRQEFCLDSGIAADVFETSVQFVTDTEPLDGGEVSYPIHDALNWTVSRFGHQARETQYAALLHQEAGSVWQAKLASPKWDRVKGRYRKYEAPVGNGSCAFLPPVPPTVRQQIAQRYGCDVPDQGSFWDWLATHPELPIVITEGAKKSLCLLSRGWIAIALYGVYAGYSAKDAWGHSAPRQLIPDLVRYAVPGRTLVLAFDQDDRQSTRAKVAQAQQRLSALLTRQGCCVRVALWQPKLGKGVDDLIVNHGENVWNTLYDNALSYEAYLQVAKLTYKPTVVLNQNYLGSLLHEIPAETRLICLQSPKGTGKTESIADLVQDAMQTGQRVLILTHRVQLGQALSDRLGVPYITELQTTETGALLGYGLCVDSLHPESQARFEAQQWKDALVVIDEAEQVIWHLLNAATDVKQHRIHILHQFQQLMAHTLNPEGCGRVILADADLSDTSINFVKRMAQQPELEPWVLINRYQPTQPWTVYAYHQGTPRQWLHALIQAIGQGHRPLVQVSGQQPGTKWGTRALERLLVRLFPALKILRIDSETVSDPDHGAYGAISNLNAILPQYDIVLASPSIETGVSIDLKGHFTSVWGAFQGLAPVDSIRQTLSRLREPVERHLWVARVGALGLIGNGTTNAYQLLKGIRQPIQGTVRVLQRVDRSIAGEFSGAHQDTATALQTWADMATRINAGLLHYREALLDGLALEGHRLIPVTALTSPNEIRAIAHVYSLLKEEADTDALDQAHAIAQSEEISCRDAEKLEGQKTKSIAERQQLRKYRLTQKYGVEVDAELVLKDSRRWFHQIRLHYYLTTGQDLLHERDSQTLRAALALGNGSLWLPDLKGSLLLHQITILNQLELPRLLQEGMEGRVYTTHDSDLNAIAQRLQSDPQGTKNLLGITVNSSASAIKVFAQILHKLGLKIQQIGRKGGSNGRGQVRLWQLIHPQDGRERVFTAWWARDSGAVVTNGNINIETRPFVTMPPPVAAVSMQPGLQRSPQRRSHPTNRHRSPGLAEVYPSLPSLWPLWSRIEEGVALNAS